TTAPGDTEGLHFKTVCRSIEPLQARVADRHMVGLDIVVHRHLPIGSDLGCAGSAERLHLLRSIKRQCVAEGRQLLSYAWAAIIRESDEYEAQEHIQFDRDQA